MLKKWINYVIIPRNSQVRKVTELDFYLGSELEVQVMDRARGRNAHAALVQIQPFKLLLEPIFI